MIPIVHQSPENGMSHKRILVLCLLLLLLLIPKYIAAIVVDHPVDFIVINHTTLDGPELDALLNLKIDQGYSIMQFSIDDGVGRDSLRRIVRNVYHASDFNPLYLLLVGTASRDDLGNDSISNAAENNLIPTYFKEDIFGTRTAYDEWYAYMFYSDEKNQLPRIIVGRIPVRSSAELGNYVDKLEEYDVDSSDAAWKHDVFLVSGDWDRGPFPDYPSPEMVNNNIDELNGSLPSEFPGSIMRYSDYTDGASRKQAFVNAVNSGQGIIGALATGSHANSLSYIIERSTFDASVDLSNIGKYPVILASSCNLGQIDLDFDGANPQDLAENLLLAPSAGAIGIVGPSGFSSDFSNYYYLDEALNRLLTRGITRIGNLNVATGLSLKYAHKGVADTYSMTTVLGDPSVEVPSRWHGIPNRAYEADMELTEAVPYQNRPLTLGTSLEDTKAGLVKRDVILGRRSYRIEGRDKAQGDPLGLWILHDNLGITIDSSTRFLSYYIKAIDHPDGIGEFGVDCIADGQRLSECTSCIPGISDQYGSLMRLLSRNEPLGEQRFYAYDLQEAYGMTIEKVLVGYESLDPAPPGGHFEALFDNIRLSATWGFPPTISPIEMASTVEINEATSASVSVDDDDIAFRGDDLTIVWSASHGWIEGTGTDVIYHAPGFLVNDVEIKALVTDEGGHMDSSMTTIDVVNSPPPTCPHLFAWNGSFYVDHGALLTASRFMQDSQIVHDAMSIDLSEFAQSQDLRFVIREDGNDATLLDQVTVTLVNVEKGAGERVGMTPEGRIVLASNPIPPAYCRDDQGFDQLSKIEAADGTAFKAYGPGHLLVRYSGLPGNGTARISAGDGGGPPIDPPPKDAYKINAHEVPDYPNYVSISTFTEEGEWREIKRIAPRSKRGLSSFVDVAKYIESRGGLWVKIEWSWSFSADFLGFYSFYSDGVSESEARFNSATHSIDGPVTEAFAHVDDSRAQILPGEEIEFEFSSASGRDHDFAIVRSVGKYEPFSSGTEGSSTEHAEQNPTMDQNVPNPFNASTRIGVVVPQECHVNLTVFNVLGQRVALIADGEYQPGTYVFTWDGKDTQGRSVSTGLYFYTLKSGESFQSKKMLYLR